MEDRVDVGHQLHYPWPNENACHQIAENSAEAKAY